MREIKFRSWDGHSLRFFDKPEDFKWFFGGSDGPERTLTSCELMQYTGIKDINGKEVYEGDIVRFMYNSTPQKEYKGEVKWNAHDLSWEFAGLLIEPTPRKTMEVIGNIYENAKVLK